MSKVTGYLLFLLCAIVVDAEDQCRNGGTVTSRGNCKSRMFGMVVYVTSGTNRGDLGGTAAEMVTSQRFTQLPMGPRCVFPTKLRRGPLPASNMRKWHSSKRTRQVAAEHVASKGNSVI